jgi:TatA/E family protein of Tat protein translocase
MEETMFEGLFQPIHMMVILVIALLFFGPGKLGDLGSSLGKGIREFKKAVNERDEEKEAMQVKLIEKETVSPETAGKEAS